DVRKSVPRMDDAGVRANRACSTVGADDHPAIQSLGLALMGDRYARQVAPRKIEADDAGAMPYGHVAEPRGGGQEAGADRAVLEPKTERSPRHTVALIRQSDPITVRCAALRKNAETLDGHCIGQAGTIIEAEFHEAGHARRMDDLTRQTAVRTLSGLDDQHRPAELGQRRGCCRAGDATAGYDDREITVRRHGGRPRNGQAPRSER